MIVKVYTRPGCHLCDEAVNGLKRLREEFPALEMVEIDIDSDEELLRRFLERIPVIEAGGEIISEIFFDPAEIRSALAGLDSPTPGFRGQVR